MSPSATTQACIARTMPAGPAASARLQRSEQVKPTTPRMSKAEALAFVEQCKKWLVAGSMVAFGVLSGLVAGHVIGPSSQAANQSNNQAAPSFNSPSDNGGFFQQGGNNFGNGYAGQQPFSGSHTSCGLLALSVAIGLALSLRLQSGNWMRLSKPLNAKSKAHPVLALAVVVLVALGTVWTLLGLLQPGWAASNNATGSSSTSNAASSQQPQTTFPPHLHRQPGRPVFAKWT